MRNPVLTGLLAVATALSVNISLHSSAEAASCRGKLGVHRTVNLNTAGGVRYGSSHGGHRNFLKHKEVVLTFDDGPNPSTTNKVLKALSDHCAKATFFMVGSMVRANTSTAKKVAAKGHTIGIHSDKHKNLGRLGAKSAIKDVDKSIRSINKNVGRNVARFFRFPYLSENKSVNRHLSAKNYGVFAIDVDSLDYRISNSKSLVNRIMHQLKRQGSKGIILMHDTKQVTARATGLLLNRLKAEGYKLVHIKGGRDRIQNKPAKNNDNSLIIASAENESVDIKLASYNQLTKKRGQAIKRPDTAKVDKQTIERSFSKLRGVTSAGSAYEDRVKVASLAQQVANKPPMVKKKPAKPIKRKINTQNRNFRKAMLSRLITN